MFKRWLIADALMFAIALSFAAQICIFSVTVKQNYSGIVYGANGPIVGAAIFASGDNGSGYATTDSSGHYSISEGLKTGMYNVSVFSTGYLINESGGVSVTAGGTTSGIDFDLQLSGGVSGTVTDAVSGTPLSGIMVYAISAGGGGTYGWQATTGTDGKYLLATNLPTGSYNVTVLSPAGHIMQSSTQMLTSGVEVKNVNFPLARSGIISGRITTPGGAAVNATITAVSGGYIGYAFTNATGYYSILTGLGTGNYAVNAIALSGGFGFNSTTALVTAGQETSGVDMWLTVTPPTPSGIIMGQVTDKDSLKPISSASVTATGLGGFGSAETDSNGNYVISSGLGTGIYNVTATAPGYQDQPDVGISVTVDVVTSNVNLPMSKIPASQSGTITGTVTGAPNPIPEFEYPMAVALSLTLVAAVVGKLFLRTKRLQNPQDLK